MFDYQAHGLIPSKSRINLPGDGPQTVATVLDRALRNDPDGVALVGRSGRYTFAELDRVVNQACQVFQKLNVQRYDRIAACLPNDVDIVIALLATARIGAIWVGVNRPLAGPEKAYILKDCNAKVYLVDQAMREEIASEQESIPELQSVICVNPDKAESEWHIMLQLENGDTRPEVELDPFEPAAIAYTSGTTGFPKGVVHSHHNILLPGAVDVLNTPPNTDKPQGVMLPLTILNLMVLAPMTAFQQGSRCVCMDSLKADSIAQWVKEEEVAHFASVPTVIFDLLAAENIDPVDLETLGCPDIGGADCSEEVQVLYKKRFGQAMTVAYGMTEAPTIVSKSDPNIAPESELCGKAVEQIELFIIDENDKEAPVDESGEVCFKAVETGRLAGIYTPMLGYWRNFDATEKALRNGLFHTGDVGALDADKNLYIRGRRNELIIRGGANVYPAEVERVLLEHPSVESVAVLGVDDIRLGQKVAAAIEVSSCIEKTDLNIDVLLGDVYAFCRERLARYKVPEKMVVIEELPRNAMNKVIKPKLASLFADDSSLVGLK